MKVYEHARPPVPRLSLHGPRLIARRGDEMSQSPFPGQPEHMPGRTSEPRRLTRFVAWHSEHDSPAVQYPIRCHLHYAQCFFFFLPICNRAQGWVLWPFLFFSLYELCLRGRCVALTDTGSGPLHASQPRSGRMGPRRQGPGGLMARPEYGSSPAGRASGECNFTSRSIAVVSVPKYYVDLTRDDARTISDSICQEFPASSHELECMGTTV